MWIGALWYTDNVMVKKKQTKPKKTEKETTINDVAESVNSLKTTVDDLAANVSNLNTTVDDLAAMTAKGFENVDKRFEQVDKRIDGVRDEVKDEMADLRENLKATRRDVLDIGDRFVPRYEFDSLLMRVGKLEQKAMKSKRKS